MGLSRPMMERIAKQAEQFSKFDGDGTLQRIGVDQWDDAAAREAFLDASFREARRIVQEEDLGDTFRFMHKSAGKVLFQFRRFAIASYSKQLLKGMHLRDWRVATHWLTSMVLGGAAFVTQQSLRLSTKPEHERRRYVESYGGWWGMFVRAGFSRASFSSLAPGAIDTAASTLGIAVFNTRSTGLSGSLLTGNPTWDLFSRGIGRGVLSGPLQAVLRGDRQWTESDARALLSLLPFQNMIGVQQMLDAMAQQLPKRDDDADPSSVNWL